VAARIWTSSGWIVGTFHVPTAQPLLAFLNHTEDFFRLTDVQLPWQSRTLDFLALQRNAMQLVLPHAGELDSDGDGAVPHQVSCLLEGGVVMGTLGLPERERVSDRLIALQHFFVLRDCTVGLDYQAGRSSVESASRAVINASRVIGVAEM
jgi:hypothetical protein